MLRNKLSRYIVSSVKKINNCNERTKLPHLASYSTFSDRDSWVVMSDDGQTIICWHPEKTPPYEHTKPLPKLQPEINEGDSALKLQYRLDEKYRFQPDGPTKEELAKMTYTTKHRWYPNLEKRYLDPNPPVDREGI